jgi:hypothetical protein
MSLTLPGWLTRVRAKVLADSVGSVGLAIAFHYGLAGFACAWYHRRVLTRSPAIWTKGITPGHDGVLLLYFFGNTSVVPSTDNTSTSRRVRYCRTGNSAASSSARSVPCCSVPL